MSWGQGEHGCLGIGDGDGRQKPTRIPGLDHVEVSKVAAGWKHSAAIDHAGRLYTWGWGGSVGTAMSYEARGSGGGQLGLGHENDSWEPQVVDLVRLEGVLEIPREYWRCLDVSLGINHSAAIVEIAKGTRR